MLATERFSVVLWLHRMQLAGAGSAFTNGNSRKRARGDSGRIVDNREVNFWFARDPRGDHPLCWPLVACSPQGRRNKRVNHLKVPASLASWLSPRSQLASWLSFPENAALAAPCLSEDPLRLQARRRATPPFRSPSLPPEGLASLSSSSPISKSISYAETLGACSRGVLD